MSSSTGTGIGGNNNVCGEFLRNRMTAATASTAASRDFCNKADSARSSSNRNYEYCINCRNPFKNEAGTLGQCNTKLFVFKTTQGSLKEVSIISVVEALSYIFGERFNLKNLTEIPSGNSTGTGTQEFEIPLCVKCGDVVQCIYNLHKEFQEMCHMDSHFQSLFSKDTVSTLVEGEENSTSPNCFDADEVDELIVPAVVYADEKSRGDDDSDEIVFLSSVEGNIEESDGFSDSNLNYGRSKKRRRKQMSKKESTKRQAVPSKPELPKSPPSKQKPRPSLKLVLGKLKEKRLIAKRATELAVEKLEWKRRRLENSLHLFRIKQNKKARGLFLEQDGNTKSRQSRPKMKANDVIPTISCQECGKTCNKRFLEAHHNVLHRKIPAYICNICGRQGRDFENLKLHLSTHRKVKRPFLVKERRTALCIKCGRTFRKSVLNLHMAIHGIPRRFNCKKCESRFENSRDLKDHQIIHEEGGYCAFKCDSCSASFKIESFLTQHHLICEMRAIERPFKCSFCQKRFKLKHHLESHLFEVHKLSKEESRGMVYPGLAKRTVNRKRK